MFHQTTLERALQACRLTIVGSALALAAAAGPAIAQEAPEKLILGIQPIAPLVPVYIAEREGFFAEEGLEVELRPEPGGQDIVTAVVAGEFHFGFSNQTSFLVAASKGLDVRAIASGVIGEFDAETAFNAVLVREDSDIETATDFEGKRVAVNTLANAPHMLFLNSLEIGGLDDAASKVEFIEVGFPDMAGLLELGQIDAAWMVEPFLTIAAMDGARTVLRPAFEAEPGFLFSVYFASGQFVDEHPEIVARFANAMNKAMEYSQANPELAREAFLEFNPNVNPEVAAQMAMPTWSSSLSADELQLGAEMAVRYGFIDAVPDLDALVFIP